MFKDICAGTGLVVIIILSMWLIRNIVDWIVDKLFACEHEWEFYDCGYYGDMSSYIELQCKKCGETKRIECDIDETKWDIEYKGKD